MSKWSLIHFSLEMASKTDFVILMFIYATFVLIFFEVAAMSYSDLNAFVADMVKENQIRYDDLALDSNRTQELAGIGSLAKGFRQYLIWDRRRTFKRVN